MVNENNFVKSKCGILGVDLGGKARVLTKSMEVKVLIQ